MKILFVSHYSFLYGSNRSLDSLIDYFKYQGIDVEVLLPSRGKFFEHLRNKEVKVHVLRFFYEVMYIKWNKKYLSLPILWIYNLMMFPLLLWKVKKIAPDVVYSNSSVDAYSIFIAKILGCKHVYHVREFLKEDFGSRFILGKKMKRRLILWSDKIIFVSKAVTQAVIGYVPKQGRIIYNGLPTAKLVKEESVFSNSLRLGVVGNIDISKQQHLAIEYMQKIHERYPQITLHIVGDKECPYKHYIQKLVKQFGLEDVVVFEGFVGNVEDIYRKLDVLLMCSRAEAFGRVTIEAMLRKVPVIGFDSGGTSELIEDGVTGFKFKNYSEVENALGVLITKPQESQRIINKAYETAKDKFSEERYTANVYDFIVNENWN